MNRVPIGILAIIVWVALVAIIVSSKMASYSGGSGFIPWADVLVWIFYCVLGIFVVLVIALMVLILALGESSEEEEQPEQQPRKREPKKIQIRQKRKSKAETQEEVLHSPPPESPQEWKEEEYE